jgi:hypothetical protein
LCCDSNVEPSGAINIFIFSLYYNTKPTLNKSVKLKSLLNVNYRVQMFLII